MARPVGVGTFAVQLAKSNGAEVTAVTSAQNIDFVRSLGADHVVDYTTTDFVRNGRRYDLILDAIGNRSVPDLKSALAGGGKAAVVGFTSVAKVTERLTTRRQGHRLGLGAHRHRGSGTPLRADRGRPVRPQIDRRYPFAEIPAAIAYLEQGHARGKVVATVE